jgi:hypothetical protein
MKEQYMKLFDKYEREASNLKASSKKVIVVFSTLEEKEVVHKKLKMSEITKFWFYFTKLLGQKSESVSFYSERIAEPQEIYWKYIGESSTHKQKVRIETTLIGVGLVLLVFVIFYFPMLKIDQEKILDPLVGTLLGLIISFVILIMVITFRAIIAAIMPMRRPSSKLAEGYFVVITVAMFFFFFYLVSPAVFYLVSPMIPDNYKLATFLMTVAIFCLSNIALQLIDLGYRTFNGKKNRLLTNVNQANAFCQGRLHEEVTPPPFPLAFKLVVAFNMWSFNSYYIFNIPYLLIFFFVTLFILYWIDKFILYNHYKTTQYLSLDLEHQAQKVVLLVFLICVSLGYLTITQYEWERWLILFIFVVAVILNFSMQYFFKKQKEEIRKHQSVLLNTLERAKSDARAAGTLNMMENELKTSFVLHDPKASFAELSEASLMSAIVMYGYQETYELYLSQFQRKEVHQMLENRCFDIKRTHSNVSRKSRESEMARIANNSLQQKLIDTANNLAKPSPTEGNQKRGYQPPAEVVVQT